MSFGHALYYPYIHLRNKNWLKHALLYWDKISRIVPVSVTPSDDEDIIAIRSKIGFIEDYAPDSRVTSNAMNKFLDRFRHEIDELHRIGYNSCDKRGCYLDHYDSHRIKKNSIYSLERSMNLSSGIYIHTQKIDRRLVKILIAMGLAEPGEYEHDSYVKIEETFGYLYMAFLANSISDERNIPIVTDMDDFFRRSQYFRHREFFSGRELPERFECSLANMLIADFLPKDINSITFDKILEIRKELEGPRILFANEIISLANQVKTEIRDESSLKDALDHYSKSLTSQCEEIRKTYEKFRIETVINFLTVSVPTSIIALSNNIIQSEFRPIAMAGGILLGLASTINKMRIEKQALNSKPLSYLLNIQNKISGKNLLAKVSDLFCGGYPFG